MVMAFGSARVVNSARSSVALGLSEQAHGNPAVPRQLADKKKCVVMLRIPIKAYWLLSLRYDFIFEEAFQPSMHITMTLLHPSTHVCIYVRVH